MSFECERELSTLEIKFSCKSDRISEKKRELELEISRLKVKAPMLIFLAKNCNQEIFRSLQTANILRISLYIMKCTQPKFQNAVAKSKQSCLENKEQCGILSGRLTRYFIGRSWIYDMKKAKNSTVLFIQDVQSFEKGHR